MITTFISWQINNNHFILILEDEKLPQEQELIKIFCIVSVYLNPKLLRIDSRSESSIKFLWLGSVIKEPLHVFLKNNAVTVSLSYSLHIFRRLCCSRRNRTWCIEGCTGKHEHFNPTQDWITIRNRVDWNILFKKRFHNKAHVVPPDQDILLKTKCILVNNEIKGIHLLLSWSEQWATPFPLHLNHIEHKSIHLMGMLKWIQRSEKLYKFLFVPK